MIFDHDALAKLAEAVSNKNSSIAISADLGISTVELSLSEINLMPDQIQSALKKERGIFKYDNGELKHLALFEDSFYQLVSTSEAPTIEIDGIQMHRTKEVKPWEDARQKAAAVFRKGDFVLDTCGGLGYTAIWAIHLGAAKVISCEPNASVRYLRNENPWSQEFYQDKIESQEIRVEQFLENCQDSCFDSILHDPPRFSLAGELYSAEFYQKLYDILKPNGRLFHYTGNPYSHGRPRLFIEGIMRRLSEIGFRVKRLDDVLGLVAQKGGSN